NLKKDALVEVCPCGTSYSFFTAPFMNMSVASDPTSSFQVRLKGKTLKALMGDSAAYFGDHVDMSDGGDDFARPSVLAEWLARTLSGRLDQARIRNWTSRHKRRRSGIIGLKSTRTRCFPGANTLETFTTSVLTDLKPMLFVKERRCITPFMLRNGRA